MSLKRKVLFVTGASRGIGRAIALRAAQDGARVVVAAKSREPHPKLPGTIGETVEAVRQAGGEGLACVVDVRDEKLVDAAVGQAVEAFGGIDILVNNAGAISLAGSLDTPMKRFDLMHDINSRGAFLASQRCLPHLLKASNPHILNICPPLDLAPRWLAPHLAYTMSKYAMSLSVIGLAAEFAEQGVAVNALWPCTLVGTAAVQNLLGGDEAMRVSRKPEIMGDAAHAILTRDSRECTGRFFTDEQVLREAGVTDFEPYSMVQGAKLRPDLYM
ncbi:MAG: NAD(P)-dependent oxidoreductase [Verrucomicrobia bacterium]|nr:NAD(P)-dependent oxidoreductase [Verrucomicrobiota bacterium]